MTYTLRYIGATWCVTCKTIKPNTEELCKKFSIDMKVYDVDEMDEDDSSSITKVPTIQIIQDDKIIETWNVNQLKSLETWLSEHISLTTDDF